MVADAAVRERAEALLEALQIDLARRLFPEFLTHVKIRDAHRGVIPFEPWPHLMELAEMYQRGESVAILKARQMGYTTVAAAYMLWLAMYRRSSNVLVISQGQDEATNVLRDKILPMWEHLPSGMRSQLKTDNQREIQFQGGGKIKALPATEKAGRSETASFVLVDEAAFHPYAQANYAAYQPTLEGGGQLAMESTSAGASGFFHDFWNQSRDTDTGVRALFSPWSARPGRDQEWYERTKAQYPGLMADFYREYPSTPEEAFTAAKGLVYDMFDPMFHVKQSPCRWEDFKWRVAGVDFGGGDMPTAIVPLGVTGQEHIHQHGEYYERGIKSADELVAALMRWHRVAPFDIVVCDPSQPGMIATMDALMAVRPGFVCAANNDRTGIALTAMLLKEHRLSIGPECAGSIREFATYRHTPGTDPNTKERYLTLGTSKHHGDAMDARRYALMSLFTSLFTWRGIVQRVVSFG